jgi:hypothetical protein
MINSFTFFDRKFAATAALLVFLAACSDQQAPQSTNVAAPDETSSSGYRQINTPSADDPLDAAIYELDNGLRVYLTENHEEPRFYAEIAVRAGSKHDPADGTGLAHYLRLCR